MRSIRGAAVSCCRRPPSTRTRRNVRKLTDEDWVRLRALSEASLVKQDQGLAKVLSVLKARNALDSTLLIVVGDVAPAAAPELPFDPAGPLTEDRLALPLIVRFPGQALAGKGVERTAKAGDLPVTVLSALGLRPEGMSGSGFCFFEHRAGASSSATRKYRRCRVATRHA